MKQPPRDDAVGARTEPVGPWRWVTDGLIEETIRVWEPRYGRNIGPEEADLILTRAVDFFRFWRNTRSRSTRATSAESRPAPTR